MKNRILGIFCVLLLVLPAVLGWFYLNHQKTLLRKEVKNQIIQGVDEKELKLFVFSPEESAGLNWKHSKEFEFHGHMYDVIRTEEIDGLLHYWCWPDNKETALNQKIDQFLMRLLGTDSPDKEKRNSIQNFYQSLFFEQLSITSIHKFCRQEILINPLWKVFFENKNTEPLSPPPRTFINI